MIIAAPPPPEPNPELRLVALVVADEDGRTRVVPTDDVLAALGGLLAANEGQEEP